MSSQTLKDKNTNTLKRGSSVTKNLFFIFGFMAVFLNYNKRTCTSLFFIHKELSRIIKGIVMASRPPLVIGGISFVCLGILFLDVPFAAIISLDILIPGILSIIIAALLIATSYSFNLITDIEEDKANNRTTPLLNHKITIYELWAFYLLACFVSLLISIYLSIWLFLISFLFIFLSFVYSYPLFKVLKWKYTRFKEIPVVKNIVIAFCWALLPLIPILALQKFSTGFLLISVFSFIQIFMGSIISDFRDIKGDAKQGILTLPIILKETGALALMFLLNTISLILILFGVHYNLLPYQFLALALIILIRYLTINFIRTKRFSLNFIDKKVNYPIYSTFPIFVLFGKITPDVVALAL